jgi:hypothetical protein
MNKQFYYDDTFPNLFYFLHFLKSLGEKEAPVSLFFRDEDYRELIPLLQEQSYIKEVDVISSFSNPVEANQFLYLKKSPYEKDIFNTNIVHSFYSYFSKLNVEYVPHTSWLSLKKGSVKDKFILNIDFNYSPKYFNHLYFYEKIKLVMGDNIYFLGTDVQFLSYTRDDLHGKHKPEYIDFDSNLDIINFIGSAKSFYGTYSKYFPIAQALGVEQLVLLANNETVNCLTENTKGYNV